ncbi:TetR/AcrR family transcriptional regulator [Winogradskya humida]|uniref:HTH tetR-type domain-containing protein n=1 Tax=Winogradskya humida TaxID=113566 RepID=A0ABQ3ZEJ8_9ACTN|nr:TetR/AcrR family transcriptional regulator [Actinoplanes humidus]GIE16980.1 hypothetical protein Ahu01nite_000820 [Actinoplanes humidus]
MGETGTDKALREGSSVKRAAIIAAARDLFVHQGVDRVSMDAVAAQAGVSKRTVYDYFGDKRRLFLAILADASDSLNASARDALDKHLPETAEIATVPQLEEALTAVAVELGTTIVGSADYAAAFALVAQQRLQTPATEDDVVTAPVENALAERFARWAAAGLLDAVDPQLATAHFGALTLLLAYNAQPNPASADPARVRQIMIDGVHAFMRAYGAR